MEKFDENLKIIMLPSTKPKLYTEHEHVAAPIIPGQRHGEVGWPVPFSAVVRFPIRESTMKAG